jgi:DNA-binding MarR family transcriptional regulator
MHSTSGKSFRARGALSEAETKIARLTLSALEVFWDLRATMPLQYVRTFLLVALNEGKSVTEYATMTGVSKSVMSRHILDIGERDRYMEEGMGLVTYRPSPMELRRHEVYLTDKGRALLHRSARNCQPYMT